MKKYLFILPSMSSGGSERVVSVLSNELTNQGREVIIAVHYEMDEAYPVNENVRLMNLSGKKERAHHKLKPTENFFHLRRLIKRENPDYIIPFSVSTGLQTAIANLGLSGRLIQTIRNAPNCVPENKWLRFARDLLYVRAWKLLVQCPEQVRYFKQKYRHKISVIYNPVDEKMFDVIRESASTGFTIASVGRLEHQKNFSLLISAVEQVVGMYPEVQLEIWGNGQLKENLKAQIEECGLSGSVHLMGRSDAPENVYAKSDLFVLPSNYEGLPNALMEAMSAGLPCVATTCPTGPSDLLGENQRGLLVPVDDAAAMRDAIICMYKDKKQAQKFGICAKDYALTHFRPRSIGEKFISLCEGT